MNISKLKSTLDEKKTLFTTLWIFVMFNYLYCDLLSNMDAGVLKEMLTGNVGNFQVTQGFMLSAAILMEIPTVLILLSRVLPYQANRWANIIAGAIMTIVQVSSLFFGTTPTLHYIFYSIIEASCTAIIVWLAWNWHNTEIN